MTKKNMVRMELRLGCHLHFLVVKFDHCMTEKIFHQLKVSRSPLHSFYHYVECKLSPVNRIQNLNLNLSRLHKPKLYQFACLYFQCIYCRLRLCMEEVVTEEEELWEEECMDLELV